MDMSPRYGAFAFGLHWASDRPLAQFAPAPGDRPPDVIVQRMAALPARPGGKPVNNGELFADGARFRFGDASFDTFGGDRVAWTAPGDAMPAAFYGTVAAIILAWRGLTPLHGSAVALGGRAVMIAGEAGAGKSTLCDALVRRGGLLISDDLTALLPLARAGVPLLQPGRPAIRLATPGQPDKALALAPMVDLATPVPFAAMVILRTRPVAPGAAEASAALTRQLFRPLWMQALPCRRERVATILHAGAGLTVFTAPHAQDRPDLSARDKAAMVIEHLRALGMARGRDAPMDKASGLTDES